ncbi:MurR/RpiR family transcriptional regulator [Carnobacteriaceae bacterium 52-44]
MQDIFFLINSYTQSFTTVEEVIADYFLNKNEILTIDRLAKEIAVSQSSITRFCKKIGLNNYKELIFLYEMALNSSEEDPSTSLEVLQKYSKIFDEVTDNYSEEKIDKFCEYIHSHKIIHFLGTGFNHFVGLDFQFRMYRLGKYVIPVADENSNRLALLQASENELVIISSISGEDEATLEAVKIATQHGVPILLITANKKSLMIEYAKVTLFTSTMSHSQSLGNISPQIPMLIQLDMIYEKYLHKYSKSIQQWIITEKILKDDY